jgi:hypothetical protein
VVFQETHLGHIPMVAAAVVVMVTTEAMIVQPPVAVMARSIHSCAASKS